MILFLRNRATQLFENAENIGSCTAKHLPFVNVRLRDMKMRTVTLRAWLQYVNLRDLKGNKATTCYSKTMGCARICYLQES